MPNLIKCFDAIKGNKSLEDHFAGITGDMTETQQREEGIRLAKEYNDKVFERTNKLREAVGLTPVDAPIPADHAAKIAEIKDRYQKKIDEAKTRFTPQKVKDTEILSTLDKVKAKVPEADLTNANDVLVRVNKAENINEGEIKKAEDDLYSALDSAPEAAHLIEPLILKLQDYEFTTKTQTGTVTEREATGGTTKVKREVRPALEQSAGSKATVTLPDGGVRRGTLNIKSGQYVLDIPTGHQIVLGEKQITDRDLKLPSAERVPEPITFDEHGRVESVTFETRNGNLVTIHDPEKALDIAIQLQAEAIGEIPDAAFDQVYKAVQKEVSQEVLINDKKNETKASVLVAPYYDTKISDLSDAAKLRESEGYKKQQEMINSVAKKMGIKIEGVDETIGGFTNSNGDKITEISNRINISTDSLDQAEEFAAVVGALSHETQEATIAAKYVELGDPAQTAIEIETKVSDVKGALKALKEAGIDDFEVNEKSGTIKVLDFSNGNDLEFDNKIVKFVSELEKGGIQHETEHRAIESRYVTPERRSELLKSAKVKANERQSGTDLRNLYEEAYKRSEDFLNPKAEPTANTESSQSSTTTGEPPKQPPKDAPNYSASDKTVLSYRGLDDIAREFGTDTSSSFSGDKKTDVQLMSDARNTITKWVKDGTYHENVEKLVTDAEGAKVITDEERIIVQQHMANIRNEAYDAMSKFGMDSKEYDAALNELKRVTTAGILTRKAAGRALRVGDKTASFVRYDIPDMQAAKMASLNVDKLTEQQKADIVKQSEEIKNADSISKEKYKLYKDAISKYEAQQKLNKTPAAPKGKKTHEQFIEQRQSLKDKLKQQVEEYKAAGNKLGIASDGGVETFFMTAKMAKTIGEIVTSHVEEIGSKLSEVTKRTLDDVKDLFDGISESDIHDVISGKYNKKQKTKEQLQIDLKNLQSEVKLTNKLAELEKDELRPKTENQKIQYNQQVKDLRDKLKLSPAQKLNDIIERNKKAAENIQDKINRGDFSKTAPKSDFLQSQEMRKQFPVLYKEAMDAINKKEDLKHDFEAEMLKDAHSKSTKAKKYVYDPARAVIGTLKAVKTGIDFSAIMIQNIVPILSHPINNIPNVWHSFLDAGSKSRFDNWLADLHNSKEWELIQKAGLDVTEPKSLSAKNKEEIFNNNLLEKDIVIKGKKYNVGKYTTAPFERAFTSLGNHIRVNEFLRLAEKFESEGYSYEENPKMYEDAANLLNTQTGRGRLPDFIQKSSETVNSVIWSPRLIVSRLNLLGLGDVSSLVFGTKGFYRDLDNTKIGTGKFDVSIRQRAALDMVKFIAAGAGIYAVAALQFGAKPDLDPRSVTFGDIQDPHSTKSYNIWGGFSQYIKLMAIMSPDFIGGGKRVLGKKVEDVTDAKGKSRLDILGKFERGKVTPLMGLGLDILDKKDYMGNPIDLKTELLGMVTPLSLSNLGADLKRDGLGSVFTNGLISIIGVNVKDSKDYKHKK